MPKVSDKKLNEELELRKEDYWENLRRNDEYKKIFKEYSKLAKNNERATRVSYEVTIANELNLTELIDPSLPFKETQKSKDGKSEKVINSLKEKINFGEGYITFLNNYTFFPILYPAKKSSFIVLDNKMAPNSDGDYKGLKLREGKRSELLTDGKYLTLLLDIDLPVNQIRRIAAESVKCAKEHLIDDRTPKGESEIRKRLKDNEKARKIFDLKENGYTIYKIAKEQFPSDNNGKQTVKHYLEKAKKLINSAIPKKF